MNTIEWEQLKSTFEYEEDTYDAFRCTYCEDGEIELPNGDTISCEHCDAFGGLDLYWNALFQLTAPIKHDYESARRIAQDNNWILIQDPTDATVHWLGSQSCGYDFTWVLARCVLALVGYLPHDYALNCSRGGHVFVSEIDALRILDEKIKACEDAVANLRRQKRYAEQEKIDLRRQIAKRSGFQAWLDSGDNR